MIEQLEYPARAAAPAPFAADDAACWLEHAARHGTTRREAVERFDRLPAVALDEMTGRWRGGGLPTGHALDGLLEAHGWYGKSFDAQGNAHPLLFRQGAQVIAIDPRWIPMDAVGSNRLTRSPLARAGFAAARRLMRTRSPQARLRLVSHCGIASAAMIYDRQPIIDLFRRVTPDVLMGMMDMRDQPPFFFTLRRTDGPAMA